MTAPVRFVTVEKFGDFSGYTPDAVRSKIKRGDWLEGAVWVKAPDGRILIDIEGTNDGPAWQRICSISEQHRAEIRLPPPPP